MAGYTLANVARYAVNIHCHRGTLMTCSSCHPPEAHRSVCRVAPQTVIFQPTPMGGVIPSHSQDNWRKATSPHWVHQPT